MAVNSKALTAKLNLDTTQFDKKLNAIVNKITNFSNKVNGLVNNYTKVETATTKAAIQQERLKQAQERTKQAVEGTKQSYAKTSQEVSRARLLQERVKQAVEKTNQATLDTQVHQEKVAQATAQTAIKQEQVKQAMDKSTVATANALMAENRINQAADNQLQKQREIAQKNNEEITAKQRIVSVMNQILQKKQAEATQQQAITRHWYQQIPLVNRVSNFISQIGQRIKSVIRNNQLLNKAWTAGSTLINRVGNNISQLSQRIRNTVSNSSRLNTAWNNAQKWATNVKNKLSQWATGLRNAISNSKLFNSSLSRTNSLTSSIWNKLKGLAATYLGIMTGRTIIDTSDTITSAQNRLNYHNSKQLGDSAYTMDAAGNKVYSDATFNATQESMDKMYASAQKVRMSYTDMMSQVGKYMTLAGDAFHNNTDNAIRFQEILAEAYAISGATSSEMHNSMSQLTQALASGTLQGDELKSLRENASMAYDIIERFVQGVYNTKDTLTELGADGKVSAEMIVAALMNAGKDVDNAFAQTAQTFSQTWEQIKNAAKYAFVPVSNMLRDLLNKAVKSGMIERVENLFYKLSNGIQKGLTLAGNVVEWFNNKINELSKKGIFDEIRIQASRIGNALKAIFQSVAKVLNKVFKWIGEHVDRDLIRKIGDALVWVLNVLNKTFNIVADVVVAVFEKISVAIKWFGDNWNWLKYIILGAALVLAGLLLINVVGWLAGIISLLPTFIGYWALTIWQWIVAHWALLLIVIALVAIIWGFEQVRNGAATMTEFLIYCAIIIATAFLIAGIIMGSIPMLVIASLLLLLAVIFMFFEQICSGVAWLAGWIVNIVAFLINLIVTGLFLLFTFVHNVIALITNIIGAAAMFIGTIVQWVVAFIVNLVVACGQSIVAISHNVVAAIINVGMGLYNSISAIAQNIGIAFNNAWIWCKNTFWEFIADVLEGVSKLEPVINGIAKLLGKTGVDFDATISNIRSKKSEYQDFVDVGAAWNTGMNSVDYKSVGEAWSNGWNTMEFSNMGENVSKGWNTMERKNYSDAIDMGMSAVNYVDPNAWSNSAGDWASGIKGSINDWGKQFQKTDGTTKDILLESKRGNDLLSKIDKLNADGSTLNNLSNLLNGNEDPAGRRFPKENLLAGGKTPSYSDTFPKASDPKYDVSDAYKIPTNEELLSGIKGNTDDINDKLDWSDDELKYLRELAHQGWTNKFTTASIKVDMSNYNTINSELDMDGIVTRLRDGLVEEMNIVANGVYE